MSRHPSEVRNAAPRQVLELMVFFGAAVQALAHVVIANAQTPMDIDEKVACVVRSADGEQEADCHAQGGVAGHEGDGSKLAKGGGLSQSESGGSWQAGPTAPGASGEKSPAGRGAAGQGPDPHGEGPGHSHERRHLLSTRERE
ncbi:unnamed protein product, partial [Effrenium voratum]